MIRSHHYIHIYTVDSLMLCDITGLASPYQIKTITILWLILYDVV